MKLYKIQNVGNNGILDNFFVVRAESAEQALRLVQQFFKNPRSTDLAQVEPVPLDDPAAIILVSIA